MPAGTDRRRSVESGQATVELALVLPVVVLLALIVAQAGLVAVDQLLLHHAARESARAAAVDPTPAAALAGAVGASRLDGQRLDVALVGGRHTGDLVTAELRYASPTDVPLVGRLIGDIPLVASVTMRVE